MTDASAQVGSSFELSQRLDEPPDEDMYPGQEPTPMHIFDIRRTNSITEIWKRFERHDEVSQSQGDSKDASVAQPDGESNSQPEKIPQSPGRPLSPETQVEDQPFMAAFEAELAKLLNPAENGETRDARSEAPTATEHSSQDGSQRPQHPLEVMATTFLYHLVHGANSVQSELRSKFPELRDHLRNAQRTVPENVQSSLQHLLASIEAHMRTAFQNFPEHGRQFAEGAFHAGRPVAENAVDGLRTMASELNEASKVLYAVFENEFSHFASNDMNTWFERLQRVSPSFAAGPAEGAQSGGASRTAGSGTSAYDVRGAESSLPVPSHLQPSDPQSSDPQATLWSGFTGSGSVALQDQGNGISSSPNFNRPSPVPPRLPHTQVSAMPPLPRPINAFYPQIPNAASWTPWNASHPAGHLPYSPLYPPQHNPELQPHHSGSSPICQSDGLAHQSASRATALSTDHSTSLQDSMEDSRTEILFIGNVGFKVTETIIQEVFASKGFIVRVRLPRDSETGHHAGFGYIYLPSIHAAIAAINALQGVHIDGHAINLEFSDDSIGSPSDLSEDLSRQQGTLFEKFSIKDRGVGCEPEALPSQPSPAPHEGHQKSGSLEGSDQGSLYGDSQKAISYNASVESSTPALIDFIPDNPAQPELIGIQDRLPSLDHYPPVFQVDAQQLSSEHKTAADKPCQLIDSLDTPSLSNEFEADDVHGSCSAPAVDFHEPTPVGRRASAKLSGKSKQSNGLDTWARLDGRERRLSRDASSYDISRSSPTGETSRPAATGSLDASAEPQQDQVEACVVSLIDLGFGTAEQGGRSRLAIYAAASNGDLADAIDMIEEERKAYDRRGPLN